MNPLYYMQKTQFCTLKNLKMCLAHEGRMGKNNLFADITKLLCENMH